MRTGGGRGRGRGRLSLRDLGGSALARAGRRTNLALLLALALSVLTGLLGWGFGTAGASRAVGLAHAVAGLAVVLLVPWKRAVVRRARRRTAGTEAGAAARLPGRVAARAGRGAGPVLALGGLVAVSVLAGLAQSLGGYGSLVLIGLSPLQVHVGAAALAVPLLVAHLRARPQRPRRTDLSRRVLLRSAGLVAGSLATYAAAEGSAAALGLPGAARRGSGSTEVGSGRPGAMPVTQWFTDRVPRVEPAWRLRVRAGGRERAFSSVELLALGTDTVRAVLDCTGGWYAEQDWTGVRLDRLLAEVAPVDATAGSVEVVSVTGYRRRLPLHDAGALLLATSMGGVPLSAGHGAPVRLVAPGRRGYWWVKWVERVEVLDDPWWRQPPFPLQ